MSLKYITMTKSYTAFSNNKQHNINPFKKTTK